MNSTHGRLLYYGTATEKAAFSPVFVWTQWLETDTGSIYAWDGSSWLVLSSGGSSIGGSGTSGYVTQWTGTYTIGNSTLKKTGAGLLELISAGAYTLTVTGTASIIGTNTGDVTLASPNHGLSLTAQVIALGTPSNITSTSTNSVTTNTHTHAVDSTIAKTTDLGSYLKLDASNGPMLGSLNFGGYAISNLDYLDFDLTPATSATSEGRLRWNSTEGALEYGLAGGFVNLQIGKELLLPRRVKNDTASGMVNGDVVYISGGDGTNAYVTLARADAESTSANTIGMLTEDIAAGQKGWVAIFGLVRGDAGQPIDTNAYMPGTVLYLSPVTAGKWTSTKPVAPNHLVKVGQVYRQHATEGSIIVNVDNGYELDELHDVAITGLASGDLLRYNGTTWANATLATAGIVPTSRTLTEGAGLAGNTYDLSANRTLAMGTPSNVTSTSINSASGTTHSHALDNVGPGATGPIGAATTVPVITIDAKGRVTALTSTTISGVAPAAHDILSASHGDTLTGTVVRGDIIIGNATPKWSRLAKGTANAVLQPDANDVAWSTGFLSIASGKTLTVNNTITLAAVADGYTFTIPATGTATIGTGATGQVAYWSGTNTVTGSNNLFWDNANGRLGIGSASPQRLLHLEVNSAAALTAQAFYNPNTTDGTALAISFRTDTTGVGAATFQEVAVIRGQFDTHDHPTLAGSLRFWTANGGAVTEKMTILANGNVGIGVTSPETLLHVQTTSAATNFVTLEGDRNSADSEVGILFKDRSSIAGGQNAGRIYVQRQASLGDFDIVFKGGNQALGDLSTEILRLRGLNGRIGVGVAVPTYNMSFVGTAAKQIGMERHTTANTAGNNFILNAGGATSGATDKNGGSLFLQGGTSTGIGGSAVVIQTAVPASTGTVTTVTLNAGGTGYSASDVLTLTGGGNNCTITVLTVSSGAVVTFSILSGGTVYEKSNAYPTTGGTGTGAKFNVTAITGSSDNSVTSRMSVEASGVFYFTNNMRDISGSPSAFTVNPVLTTAISSSAAYRTFYLSTGIGKDNTATEAYTGQVYGIYAENQAFTSGLVTSATGAIFYPFMVRSTSTTDPVQATSVIGVNVVGFSRASGSTVATVGTMYGYYFNPSPVTGLTATNVYGYSMANFVAGSSTTTFIGVEIPALFGQNAAGTNFGIRIATPAGGTINAALNLSGTGGTAASGILFGTSGSGLSNLYRNAADSIKTDGTFVVGVRCAIGTTALSTVGLGVVNNINPATVSGTMISGSGTFTVAGVNTSMNIFGANIGATLAGTAASGAGQIAISVRNYIYTSSSHSVGILTFSAGIEVATGQSGAGTISDNYGVKINTPANSGGGTITRNYGLKIENQNVGTTYYSIYTGTGQVRFGDTTITTGRKEAFVVKTANYTLTANDELVVVTATCTQTLPAATGSGQRFRIANEGAAGVVVTIDANASETIKGELTQLLYPGEDLILTDYKVSGWC